MNEYTTQELLKKLQEQGHPVTHDQLKYWRRHGLLPTPIRRGLGRGQGIEQIWDAACIDNVRIILDSNQGKRVHLTKAGQALLARHQRVGAMLLRRCLREIPVELIETKQRQEANDQHDDAHKALIHFLTPQAIKLAIDKTDDDALIHLYERINQSEPPSDYAVDMISNCHPVFDVLVDTEFPDFTGSTQLSSSAHYRRLRSTFAWAVLLRYYGMTLIDKVNAVMTEMLRRSADRGYLPPFQEKE